MTSPQDWTDCISDWKRDAASLSYEEALQAVDLLLADLQSDSVPLADLQKQVVHGEIYLNHCEALLKAVEASRLKQLYRRGLTAVEASRLKRLT